MADPLGAPETAREIASRGVTAFALELIPRITRAQSMDVLSSMATIAGYKAVLLAAGTLPRMFPLLTTAAGTDHAGARLHRRCRRRRTAGDCDRAQAGRGRRSLRRAPGGERAGAERRREVRRAAARDRSGGRQGRLREGAGRSVLSAPARDDGARRRGQRRRHHDGRRAGKEGAGARDRRHGARHGARIGHRGSRGRARRQLRADARRSKSSSRRASRFSGRRICLRPCRITPARCTRRTSRRSCCTS